MFVINKKKLIKIISPPNSKIVAVKIFKVGKKIIIAFRITILTSSGMEIEKTYVTSYTSSQIDQVKHIIPVRGGATP